MTESNQMTAVFSAVAQVPNILTNVNTAMQAGKTAVQVPAAAVGAAPTPASWAVVGLGVEMVIFLLKTAEAIKQDIEGVVKAMENTEQTESETLREAQAAADAFSRMYAGARTATAVA